MSDICVSVPMWVKIVVPTFHLSYMILEYWIGKTEKTKAGSVLEFLLHIRKNKE